MKKHFDRPLYISEEYKPIPIEEILKIMQTQLDIIKLMFTPQYFDPLGSGIKIQEGDV